MTPEEFKSHRVALDMTQKEFADFLGYNSDRYIRDLESGARPITARTENLVNLLIKDRR